MEIEIIVTVVAGILLVVAAIGTVVPVLPGSLLAAVTLVVWGAVVRSPVAWVTVAVCVVVVAVGWSASLVLTGRKLKQREIPKRSVLVAVAAALVGMYFIPVVGLFVGFAVGLLLSEYVRCRDVRAAVESSVEALKATGIGILVEFCLVCLAASLWAAGVAAHFATR